MMTQRHLNFTCLRGWLLALEKGELHVLQLEENERKLRFFWISDPTITDVNVYTFAPLFFPLMQHMTHFTETFKSPMF